ncbi:MAG: formate dehydrogenase iron-sulfur subunit [Chthoniobacter sp.]|jgi:Fe-S-cluster-containing dehydrogenase component/DMSO reductase anchor subunit|nr:formate dehydrogenase iron-sulfur subunit [Chthoniobacter sp.]
MPKLATEDSSEARTLIDDLLTEQRTMTAVAKFSRLHERHEFPAQAKYYRDLIPLERAQTGQQYAFAVDLDACTGCKACVTACHNLNGLDDEETWREVGVLFGGTTLEPVQQTVTTACHHCVDPACMNGCPVLAYEKDEVTGIVRHLDDQCIGCQYCILKCPYDVPKYSKKRGIVRKCDMCSSRLAVGEAPACVQSCPNEAIRIEVVNKAEIVAEARQGIFLPDSPDPAYTQPTTRYRTTKTFPANMTGGDHFRVKPEHAHPALVVMLVLTQLSVGAFCAEMILRVLYATEVIAQFTPFHSLVALGLGLLAIGASTLHLGRPLYAWRAFVGLRTSWLSREIIVFSAFAGLASLYAGMFWLPFLAKLSGVTILRELAPPLVQRAIGIFVAFSGVVGIACSAMIYQDTRRKLWTGARTFLRFFGSAALLGLAATLFTTTAQAVFTPGISSNTAFASITAQLSAALIAVTLAKIGFELMVFTHLRDVKFSLLKRSALLLSGELAEATSVRALTGAAGGIALPFYLLFSRPAPGAATVGVTAWILVFALLGELTERYLFFTAVVPPKMPGGMAA